jgi:hypothetical protein
MTGIEVKGLRQALRVVESIARQKDFALAKAMNRTLQQVQGWSVDEHLPGVFTLRARGAPWQKPGTKFGFNQKFAGKRKLEARLGSQADWLKLQEKGGTKRAAGHRLAIPTRFWKSKSEIIEAKKKPGRILMRGESSLSAKPFVYAGPRMGAGIYVRTGDGRLPIVKLFAFVDTAKIEGLLDWEDKAENRALARFEENFRDEFRAAIATARTL